MVSRRVQALLDQLRAQGIQDEQVLNALAAVPREKFVDEAFEQKAWDNIALPIGQGQTISQPYMVARMTELLELTPQSRVLEIGTGSGYQTAILAHLVQHVCSVERIKGLQWQARRRLKNLDLHNVSTRHGDGWQGWQADAHRAAFRQRKGCRLRYACRDLRPILHAQAFFHLQSVEQCFQRRLGRPVRGNCAREARLPIPHGRKRAKPV